MYKRQPQSPLQVKISAQGGVGTAEEHQFLLEHYKLDSVGWGTPFLLVPEVTTVDNLTMAKLSKAKENDLYLSNISPLGVPFNSLKGNTKDLEKMARITKGRPGSPCPKKYVALNKEFTNEGLCTASRQYQHLKLKELDNLGLPAPIRQEAFEKIVEKSCACVGLGTAALLKYGLDTKKEGKGVSVCPGPNMAYFSKIVGLREMTEHIYGVSNLIERLDRPNMFIKELGIYIDYLKIKIEEARGSTTPRQLAYLTTYTNNLYEGISYYQTLLKTIGKAFLDNSQMVRVLDGSKTVLDKLSGEIHSLKIINAK